MIEKMIVTYTSLWDKSFLVTIKQKQFISLTKSISTDNECYNKTKVYNAGLQQCAL